jgi:hypothetical protein
MFDQKKLDDFLLNSEEVIKSKDKEEAVSIILSEIDKCEDIYLFEFIIVLNELRSPSVLNWIENNAHRIQNVNVNWGHLAASSFFNWETAKRWLSNRRPLSLIALDALVFCTSFGERLDQSPWMRKIQPKLDDYPGPNIIAERLQEYLKIDSVPRSKRVIQKIMDNIFDAHNNQ